MSKFNDFPWVIQGLFTLSFDILGDIHNVGPFSGETIKDFYAN